jgi:AcrR family transcriptional regulator
MTPTEMTPRAREILSAARKLLEADGPDALSMRNLAERLDIKAPSLYKHFPSKEALEAGLISEAFEEQAELFEAGLKRSRRPIAAMANAYREFGRRHPHLYRLMYDRSLNRELLTPTSEARAAAPLIHATGDDEDLARAIWAFAHGMTILELNDRFGLGADLEAAWKRGLAALEASVALKQ